MPYQHSSTQPFNLQRCLKHLFTFSTTYAALCALVLSPVASAVNADRSSAKRGLVDIQTLVNSEQDNSVLTGKGSDITWYYNYGSQPTASITNLNYVPMLWGGSGNGTFMSNVTTLLKNGVNITAVMGFNEPDGCNGGGSCLTPTDAADIWIAQIEPLKKSHGLLLGSPATTGSDQGIQWYREWFTACNGGCNPDFMTAHFYGGYSDLASWIGQLHGYYSANVTGGLWLTEFAYPSANLSVTQTYYNETINFLDQWSYITHYAYFGAFRSVYSNIGVNAAFFTGAGKLTDIGSWYMSGNSTGTVCCIVLSVYSNRH